MSYTPAPPHDEQAEKAILGACLLAPVWVSTLTTEVGLRPEHFYRPRNQQVFRAAVALADRGEPVDTLTVADELGDKLEGGQDYLETLVAHIPNIANTKSYGAIVKEKAALRRLLLATQQIEQLVADESPAQDVFESAHQLLGEAADPHGESVYTPEDLMELAVAQLTGDPVKRYSTGFSKIDEWTNGGLARGQVMVVAAWPNTSKSVYVDQIAAHMAMNGLKTCIYLTEMTVEERNARFIARHSELTITEAITGNLTAEQSRKMQGYKPPPVHIQPAAGWTVDELCRDVLRRRWDLIVVDDIENLSYDYSHGKQEAKAELSRRLAVLTKDNQANCIALVVSHLSRPADKDKNYPRPKEGHLRDTQMIAARADICCFLHREQDELGAKLPETEVYFSRNRTGHAGASTYLDFDWKHVRLDERQEYSF